jgi:hypothetical protein
MRKIAFKRAGAVAAAAALVATGIVASAVPQAQADGACGRHAAWVKINWDSSRHVAAADVMVGCPKGQGTVYFQMVHPTSQSGPCHGYGNQSGQVHYSFHPDWSWTPIGTSWKVIFCSGSGTGDVPKWAGGTGGGGSW